MRVESLSPLVMRSLLAALPKAAEGFRAVAEDAAMVPRAHPAVAQPAAQAAPQTSVQMLVMLAAAEPSVERRRRMAKDAQNGLDALETLRREMLAGTLRPERLREIAAWSQALETPDDPQLAALLSEIDLRVRVELAKYDVEI